jgi:hypothetical protein
MTSTSTSTSPSSTAIVNDAGVAVHEPLQVLVKSILDSDQDFDSLYLTSTIVTKMIVLAAISAWAGSVFLRIVSPEIETV